MVAVSKEPTLSELIADKKGDRSYDTLAEDCGGAPSRQRLHQLLTKELRNFPDPVSIEGLARGLAVPVTDVIMASARSLGLRVYSGNDPDALLIGGAGKLPSTAKDTVIRVARQFLELTSQLADGRADEDTSAAQGSTTSGSDGSVPVGGQPPMNEPSKVTPLRRRRTAQTHGSGSPVDPDRELPPIPEDLVARYVDPKDRTRDLDDDE